MICTLMSLKLLQVIWLFQPIQSAVLVKLIYLQYSFISSATQVDNLNRDDYVTK